MATPSADGTAPATWWLYRTPPSRSSREPGSSGRHLPREVRALESQTESERRPSTFYHATQLRLRLTFATAYSGTLHLYALDWDSLGRRQNVTVNDGSSSRTINIRSSFSSGAWMHFPISVSAGGQVTITVDRVSGTNTNAVLSGLFLGGPGTPPTPTPPPYEAGPQGNWVGNYGANGFAIGGWNSTSDLVALPNATLVLDQGTRFRWAPSTTDVRALESPTESERRPSTVLPRHPAQAAAHLRHGVFGHAPSLRTRLGHDGSAPERDRE